VLRNLDGDGQIFLPPCDRGDLVANTGGKMLVNSLSTISMLLHYSQKGLGRNKSASRASNALRLSGESPGASADGKGSAARFARAQMMPHDPRSDEQDEAPSLSDEAQKQIGRKLRLLYEQLEAEPIPDKFVDLLRALAEKESKPR
jgi:hypothetical protein